MRTRSLTRGERLVAVLAALVAVVAAWVWTAPFVVPARQGLPFGCGSPARPNALGLARSVCGSVLDGRRSVVACAALLAVALLLLVVGAATPLGEGLRRRGVLGRTVASAGMLLTGLAAGIATLVVPVVTRSSDGQTVVSCGSALNRTGDAFARGLCADLPDARLALGLAIVAAGVVASLGLAWAAAGAADRPEPAAAEPVDSPADGGEPDLFRPAGTT